MFYIAQGLDQRKRKCVVVPESNSMKRRRIHVTKAVLEQTIDDGEDALILGQVDHKHANTVKDLSNQADAEGPRAVGVPMNALQPRAESHGCVASRATPDSNTPPSSTSMLKTKEFARRLLKRSSSLGSGSDVDSDMKRLSRSIGHEDQEQDPPARAPKAKTKAKAKAKSKASCGVTSSSHEAANSNSIGQIVSSGPGSKSRGRPFVEPSVKARVVSSSRNASAFAGQMPQIGFTHTPKVCTGFSSFKISFHNQIFACSSFMQIFLSVLIAWSSKSSKRWLPSLTLKILLGASSLATAPKQN